MPDSKNEPKSTKQNFYIQVAKCDLFAILKCQRNPGIKNNVSYFCYTVLQYYKLQTEKTANAPSPKNDYHDWNKMLTLKKPINILTSIPSLCQWEKYLNI